MPKLITERMGYNISFRHKSIGVLLFHPQARLFLFYAFGFHWYHPILTTKIETPYALYLKTFTINKTKLNLSHEKRAVIPLEFCVFIYVCVENHRI